MWLYTFVFDHHITLLVCGVLVGICLLKKLTRITVECVKEKFTQSDVGYSNFNEIMFMYDIRRHTTDRATLESLRFEGVITVNIDYFKVCT
jgi:hypothetical protein